MTQQTSNPTSSRLDCRIDANTFKTVNFFIPAAMTIFPNDIDPAPRSWAEQSCYRLICFHKPDQPVIVQLGSSPQPFRSKTRTAFGLPR